MEHVKVLNIPDEQRVFVIGDIHGNYELYQTTLFELGITTDDVVISVGDIIDRGTNNTKMLFEFLHTPNRYMVLGNHEDLMMKSQQYREWDICWRDNGGLTTLDEIGLSGVKYFNSVLSTLPHLIEVNHRGYKLGVAHAGIPHYPGIPDWNSIKEWTHTNGEYRHHLLWDRNSIQMAIYDNQLTESEKLERIIAGVDYVIHGHTGVDERFEFGNRVWIDTQFRTGQFTVAQMNYETHLMKYFTLVPDEWGTNIGYTIKEL